MDDISGGVCTARLGPTLLLLLHLPPLSFVKSLPYSLQLRPPPPFCLPSSEMCPSHRCLPLLAHIPVKALPPRVLYQSVPILCSRQSPFYRLWLSDCLCTPHSIAGIPLSTSKLDPNHYLFSAHTTSRPLRGLSCCRNANPFGFLSEPTM